jgi:hypothetical protein
MSNQGFKPRKLYGSLTSKLEQFQKLYEEIMQEIQAKPSERTELRSLSPRTFSKLVQENFGDDDSVKETPKQSLYRDIT